MSQTVTLNGVPYVIPSPGDTDDWGARLNAYLVALGAAAALKSPMAFTFGGTQLENATRYLNVGGPRWPFASGTIPTADQFVSAPAAGTITRLDVQLATALVSTTGSVLFTVRKRTGTTTSDTLMVATINCVTQTGTLAHVSTVLNPFTVAAGDGIAIKVLDTGTNAAVQGIVATLSLTPS